MYFNEKNKDTDYNYEFEKKKIIDFKNANKISKMVIYIGGIILVIIIILLFTLKGPDKKIKYFLTLNGEENIIVYEGNKYIEDGYKAYDSEGNEYNNEVIVTGNVDSSVSGDYEILYKFNEIEKKRKIKVVSLDELKSYFKLNGDNPLVISLYDNFTDPGVSIVDSPYTSQKMLENVKKESNVDTSKTGKYEIMYTFSNDNNVSFSISRTVVVSDSSFVLWYSPVDNVKDKVTIQGVILSDDFTYLMLPDGRTLKDKKITYEVTENKVYSFKLFDKDGNFLEKEIEIKNIIK